MKCPTCEQELDQGLVTCPFCGADLAAIAQELSEGSIAEAYSTDMSSKNVQDIQKETEK